MTTQTFTKRSNAKRAAIKAGMVESEIEITVHKSADGVRFGWAKKPAHKPMDEATPELKPVKRGKKEAPVKTTPAKQPRPEQNGVKMPREGTKCRAVWDWANKFTKDTGSAPDAATAREHAERAGWNVNNTIIEAGQWKRFLGLTQARKAATKSA